MNNKHNRPCHAPLHDRHGGHAVRDDSAQFLAEAAEMGSIETAAAMNAVPSPSAIKAARITDFFFMYLPLCQPLMPTE